MRRWAGLLLALGFGLRLALAWLPVERLIAYTVPDDGFIYFVIARNLGAGLGATFDGLHATNGFHPLWALILAPLFGVLPSGDLPVHLALSLGALFDAAAGGLTALIVWRVSGDRGAALISLALYLFNPRLIQESINGLETGLALLAVSGALAAYLWAVADTNQLIRSLGLGAALGLTLLARSDLAIVGAVLLAAYAWRVRRAAPVGLTLAGWGAVIAPWFIWSQLRVGTVVQSSGVAIPSLVAARIQSASDFGQLWNSLLLPVINFSLRDYFIYPGVTLLGALIGMLLSLWSRRGEAPARLAIPAALWLPLAGASAIVAFHTLVRWYPRGWYFTPVAWGWVLLAGPLLAAGLKSQLGRRLALWLPIAFAVITIAQAVRMLGEPDYGAQPDMRAAAAWLTDHTPKAAVVGALNAGIYAYYSQRQVLGLDGLVDWGAINARQKHQLLDYFVAQGGSLLIDHKAYIESFSGYFGGRSTEPVAELPVRDHTYGPIVVWSVH